MKPPMPVIDVDNEGFVEITLRAPLMSGNMTATFNGSEFYIYQPKETYFLSGQ